MGKKTRKMYFLRLFVQADAIGLNGEGQVEGNIGLLQK
jgi:hypothetical protein